jgi:hypothetical protein
VAKNPNREAPDFSRIGTRSVVRGKLVWTPPRVIDPMLKRILLASVRALNQRVEKGEIRLIPKK